MKLTPNKLNLYLMFKLPSAFLCGVRTKYIDETKCITSVKYRWINQNPFKSMFWAVQGMAAELTTGALVMNHIKESDKNISMLIVNNNATFIKKAIGRITFVCHDGNMVNEAISRTIKNGEGQTIWMKAIGTNTDGVEVSTFNFEWTIKLKSQN